MEVGHKALGTLGLRAGAQAEPGVYLADRFVAYSADELVDRRGDRLDVGLNLAAQAGAFGVKAVFLTPFLATHVSFAAAVPIARIHVETTNPLASIDRFGLGDAYFQPLQLGWRLPGFDVVTGYGIYVPTGRFEPKGGSGVGRGYLTHQFSLGGTVYFDRARTWHLSALASYDLNGQKRGIDITRGDTIQIQGGAGKRMFRLIDVGVVGYALWQVRDDRGADLPDALRGSRDRSLGLGGEVSALVPPLHGQLSIRYAHDVMGQARTLGQIVVLSFTVVVAKLH
ncbi:MAG: SphA family protein [Polyangiales bacterium]